MSSPEKQGGVLMLKRLLGINRPPRCPTCHSRTDHNFDHCAQFKAERVAMRKMRLDDLTCSSTVVQPKEETP
jgi:hypothetical protein